MTTSGNGNERKRQFHSRTHALEALEGVNLSGKTIAITGTTSGIGVETARALVMKGANIVMLNRNVTESEKQKRRFIEEKPNAHIHIVECDLNSLASVRKAANVYLENGWSLEEVDLSGKIIAITGTTSGIGVETARALVMKGANIVMLNRNVTESEKQKRRFIEEKPNAHIHIVECDLNSLASVKKAMKACLIWE